MIFRKIFTAELVMLARRKSTWAYVLVLFTFAIGMKLLISTGDGVYPNNTLHLTGMTVIGCLIWLVIGGSVSGEAAARDVQMRIHPLIYTTPVAKINLLAGRFLAALAVNALIILALPVGLLLSFYLPETEPAQLLPFRPEAYLNIYFLIALPTVFVSTAIQFAAAVLTRRVMASYMASMLLAVGAQVIPTAAAKLFGNWDLARLLDPVGIIGIINGELATWAVAEKNTRLVELEGMFLWNRLLWFGVAAGLLWFTGARFRFTSREPRPLWHRFKTRKRKEEEKIPVTGVVRGSNVSVPDTRRNFGLATQLCQTAQIAGKSFKQIAGHPAGLAVVAFIVLISVAFSGSIISEMGIPLAGTTAQVLSYFAAPLENVTSPWVVIPLLILYFSGELIWHERESGISDVADAAPTQDWVVLAGKFLGLALMVVLWVALLMIGGIAMQAILGAETIELPLYLKILFGLQLSDYLLFALLAFTIHVVLNQKYVAFLVILAVFAFMAFPASFGVEHPMLIYGSGPGWSFGDMRGFGPTLGPWLWFKAYWLAWGFLLAVAAKLFWPRGKKLTFSVRIMAARQRFSGTTTKAAIAGAGLILIIGGFLFYNTNVLNDYKTAAESEASRAGYERLFSRYKNTPQPQLTGIRLEVELYPERQQALIYADYTLVNKEPAAIDTVHIASVSGSAFSKVTFDRPAKGIVNKEFGHDIYVLKNPLLPGDTLRLNFTVQYRQPGFDHKRSEPLVVKNGTHFTNYDLLPRIGYQQSRELDDPAWRKQHHLAARPALPSLYDEVARKKTLMTDQAVFEAVIGTSEDETAVAPGALQRTWTSNNRRYFHYRTDAQIGGEYRILSSSYAVKKDKWKDVSISLYYHPGHAQNVDRMLGSAKTSLEYFNSQFGPYPFKHLTLAEGAGPGAGASADAGIIYYGEQYAQMLPDDSPDGCDLPFYIMAHEMAHQWWGTARLTPANVEGAGVLIEALAVYSGMLVLEKTYGEQHLQKYVEFLHSSYAMPRSLASASLLRANEPFLYYKKGGLAMFALSRYIGTDKVNFALRRLLEKRQSVMVTTPTTLDLYRELESVTPDSLRYLLKDMFLENTYWRLKTESILTRQTSSGNWDVTMTVNAQKFAVSSAGIEIARPMNDWLEIGLNEKQGDKHKLLYSKMHRLRSGRQEIKMRVPRKPSSGGIDPRYLMIDVRLEDNIMEVE